MATKQTMTDFPIHTSYLELDHNCIDPEGGIRFHVYDRAGDSVVFTMPRSAIEQFTLDFADQVAELAEHQAQTRAESVDVANEAEQLLRDAVAADTTQHNPFGDDEEDDDA